MKYKLLLLIAPLLSLPLAICAAKTVVLNFTDNSTEICEASDIVFDFETVTADNVQNCKVDRIFTNGFEAKKSPHRSEDDSDS